MLDPTVNRKSLFSYLRWDCGAPNPYAILGEFLGTYFPNIAYGFGGPRRASSPIYRTDLVGTAVRAAPATSRLSVPTLPSRAHPQDYGRRTTPSNYISITGIKRVTAGLLRGY